MAGQGITRAQAKVLFAPVLDTGGRAVLRTGDATSTVTVLHGANSAVARPSVGTGTVRWVGSVQPTAMTSTDLWVQTLDPALLDPVTMLAWRGVYFADRITGAPDGTVVSSWTDLTGNGLHLTPNGPLATGNALFKTAPGGYNGSPAVQFNNSPLGSPIFAAMPQPSTAVLVGNVNGNTQGLLANANGTFSSVYRFSSMVWRASAGGTTLIESPTGADINPHLFIATFSNVAGVGNLRIDGVDSKGAIGTNTRTQFRLGLYDNATAGNLLSGYVAFAGFVGGILTAAQLSALESWARAKYGIVM